MSTVSINFTAGVNSNPPVSGEFVAPVCDGAADSQFESQEGYATTAVGAACGTVTSLPNPPQALGGEVAVMSATTLRCSNATTTPGFCLVVHGTYDQDVLTDIHVANNTTSSGSDYEGTDAIYFSTTYKPNYTIWFFDDADLSISNGDSITVALSTLAQGLVLAAQAAGNAGSDVLLTWTAPDCADTTFEIKQNGTTVATIPAINQGNNVFNSVDSQFNYGYAVAQLTPNTAYNFEIVGDINGASNQVTVTTGCRGVEIFNCDCSLEPVQQTLAELRSRVLVRLGYPNQATNPPPGMALLVDAFLYDAQKLIWKQLSRAGLNVERFFRWIMVPGQRYYGINANADKCDLKLDPYKVVWAGFEDLNNAWYRLTEGVPPEFYTRANINFGWPTHYEIRSCIEIFPAPQAPYTLWIKGDFGLASFVDDDDTATIDDQAVFLLALGMAKSHYGQQDGTAVLAQADTYIRGLVAGLHGTRRYVPRTSIQNPATPPKFLPLGNQQA